MKNKQKTDNLTSTSQVQPRVSVGCNDWLGSVLTEQEKLCDGVMGFIFQTEDGTEFKFSMTQAAAYHVAKVFQVFSETGQTSLEEVLGANGAMQHYYRLDAFCRSGLGQSLCPNQKLSELSAFPLSDTRAE